MRNVGPTDYLIVAAILGALIVVVRSFLKARIRPAFRLNAREGRYAPEEDVAREHDAPLNKRPSAKPEAPASSAGEATLEPQIAERTCAQCGARVESTSPACESCGAPAA